MNTVAVWSIVLLLLLVLYGMANHNYHLNENNKSWLIVKLVALLIFAYFVSIGIWYITKKL